MGKGNIKFGGKSGVLPRIRPIFRKYPLREKTAEELAEEKKIPQGYSDEVPVPKRKGFEFHRKPPQKPVVTLQERIKRNIDDRRPVGIDESKLSLEEIWDLKRDEVRREFLRDAYLTEARNLEKLEKKKMQDAERKSAIKNFEETYEVSEATKLTLPTIDSYLQQPIMRQRTSEEQDIIEGERALNRKLHELEVKEKQANDLLELYHAAGQFITTEEELENAINDAFEVNVSKFESKQMIVENKLSGYSHAFSNMSANEGLIIDEALGQIDGNPGYNAVKDTLEGHESLLKRQAQVSMNERSL